MRCYGIFQKFFTRGIRKHIQKRLADANNAGRFAAGSTSSEIAHSIINAFCGKARLGVCLDHGGGQGKIAEKLLSRGADVSVFEPFGEKMNKEGIEWYSCWEDQPPGKKYDWVFMVEVIEHLLEPEEELSKIKDRMAPGGKLVITTPNARGWRARLEGTNWREAQNPTHINLFSPYSIKVCLQKGGFDQIDRIFRPVRYSSNRMSALMLGITQVLGIDGGLKVVARSTI